MLASIGLFAQKISLNVNLIHVSDATSATSNDEIAYADVYGEEGEIVYEWSNSNSVGSEATDLPMGWAWVTVSDAMGRVATDSIWIGIMLGIEEVEIPKPDVYVWYDLSGRVVQTGTSWPAENGLYIVRNGNDINKVYINRK